jgi:hypothetical protein
LGAEDSSALDYKLTNSFAYIITFTLSNMAKSISLGGFGAVMTEDESTNGYYIVKGTATPYIHQEDSEGILAGDLVCYAVYLNLVGRAQLWYTESTL